MILRLFLLFILIHFAQTINAQDIYGPELSVENILFKPVTNSDCTLYVSLIASLDHMQAIYRRDYSIDPDSIVRREGMSYAVWNLEAGEKAKNISINTIIQKLEGEDGVCYGATRKYTYIESEGQRFKKRVNRKKRSLWHVARNLYERQRSDEAIDIYDILIEINPEQYSYYLYKGLSLARIGEFDEAIYHLETAERLAETQKDKMKVVYAKANYYALMGNKEQCVSFLNDSILGGFDPLNKILEEKNLAQILKQEEITEIYTLAERNRPNRY